MKIRQAAITVLAAGLTAATLTACGGGAGSMVTADSNGLLPVKIGYTAPGAGYAYDFFLKVWAQTPVVDPKLIRQAFTEAAQKANVAAPTDVAKYIDNTLGSTS